MGELDQSHNLHSERGLDQEHVQAQGHGDDDPLLRPLCLLLSVGWSRKEQICQGGNRWGMTGSLRLNGCHPEAEMKARF